MVFAVFCGMCVLTMVVPSFRCEVSEGGTRKSCVSSTAQNSRHTAVLPLDGLAYSRAPSTHMQCLHITDLEVRPPAFKSLTFQPGASPSVKPSWRYFAHQ